MIIINKSNIKAAQIAVCTSVIPAFTTFGGNWNGIFVVMRTVSDLHFVYTLITLSLRMTCVYTKLSSMVTVSYSVVTKLS